MLITGVSKGIIEQNPMKFSQTLFWTSVGFVLLLPICWVSCCKENEKNSLLNFRRGLHDPSGRLKTWNNSTDCCHWKGIQCDNITKYVIQLDLHNPLGINPAMGLRNSTNDAHSKIHFSSLFVQSNKKDILSPLFDLKMLQVLDLSYNSFIGVAVPQQLPKLKYLQYLNLSNAGFVGTVPRELGNMSTLRHLDLSTNSFISISSITIDDMQMWIGNMRDLEELLLDGVDMSQVTSDEWGKAISTMHTLRRLQMSNCMLSAPIPPSLANLTRLTHLQLGGNSFFSSIPAGLHNLSNLVSLKLSSCELNGSIPSDLLSLPNLQEVDLSANFELGGELSSILPPYSASLNSLVLTATSVGGAIPDSIANISSLTLLDLSECFVQGKLPPTIANLTELVMLDISNNELNGSLPSFGVKPSLAYVDLSYNQLDGYIPSMNKAFGSIRFVDLSHNLLTGAIPSPGMNLTSLTSLDLSYNELNGTIPPLANMKSLVLLDLSNNHLTGKLPASVVQLLDLGTLDLSNNLLTDVIPDTISNLSKLKVLSLFSNRLNGNLSESHLHTLSSLVYLDISNNNLTVKVSPTWIPQNSFRTLKLRSCNMEGEFPAFLLTQTQVSDLDLSDNHLWGNIPAWIWESPALQQFNLSYNKFTGALPSKLLGHTKLKVLDLHHNNFQGPLPLSPPSVVVLDLSENQFHGSIPGEIGKYAFNYLSLSHNNLSGSIPSTICELGLFMEILDFSYNSLTGKIPPAFVNCSSLQVLNLESNSLEGELPAELGNMASLQTLKVGGNRLNGALPSLANCTQLQILDIRDNSLTGNISSNWILELPSLKILILRSNRFEGSVPADVSKVPSLQILDLSMNSLTGAIPDNISEMKGMANESERTKVFEYGSIKHIKYVEKIIIRSKGLELEFVRILSLVKCLDLSSNRLSGHIPEGMRSLRGLIFLNISRNNFNGGIPKSLGNMTELESLDLSQNNLSGIIPTELQLLTFLSYLNLSYNNLRGPIPQGAQFATFEASSFSHNAGLYGFQLNESWSPSPKEERKPKKEEGMNKNRAIDSFIILMGMSFGVGAGIIVVPLLFLKKRREKFFHLLDSILMWVVDLVPSEKLIPCDKLQMAKISDAEDIEHSKESKKIIRFCVRCTQIDRETKNTVHTKCICRQK